MDDNRRVAVKVEKYSKSMLRIEVDVLKTATQQKCTRILELIEYGSSRPNYCFLVMPLLGRDLSTLRNEQQTRSFTRATVVRVGILSLQAVQELHQIGFLSRDIKPGNFAIGLGGNDRRIYLFDFGLARRYVDKNRNIIPARPNPGWRGTTRYGSLQAHLKQDLSRKDDVESWFYLLVEITKGALPWKMTTNRDTVQAAKRSARVQTRSTFLDKCPQEYDEMLTHIDSLAFADAPNYEKLVGLLEAVMKQHSYKWDQRFDWEADDEATASTMASSSCCEDECAGADRVSR